MIQVAVDPVTVTEHEGVVVDPSVPQLAEPVTSDVPDGAVSVMVSGATDVEPPVLVATTVYVSGVAWPGVAREADTCFTTVNAAGLERTVVAVLVGQVVAVPVGVQPGPVQRAVLVTVPLADADTAAEKVRVTEAPGATPEPIVQVIVDPDTEPEQLTAAGTEPHATDPAVNVVPLGTWSVTVTPVADEEEPMLVATNVYCRGVCWPGAADAADTCLTTVKAAGESTVVVTELVGHSVAGATGEQPSPVQWAMLVTVPVVVLATVTANVRVND